MNIRYFLVLLPLSSSMLSGCNNVSENDFDKVCGYFQQLEQLPRADTMTHIERNEFILNKISQGLQAESNARVAWEAISYAEKDERYSLFKSAAEDVHSSIWDCPAMEKLAAKTGEF